MRYAILLITLISYTPSIVIAQMFSVDEEQKNEQRFNSSLYVGYSDVSFEYIGDSPAISGDQSLEMTPSLINIQYHTPGVRIDLIGGNQFIGNDKASFVRLGVELGTESFLLRKPRLQIAIPFRVETAITAATKEGYASRFYQTAFSGGFGGIIRMRPARFFTLSSGATKWYGFSNSAGNFFGGNTDQFKTETTLRINPTRGGRGFYLSYETLFQDFNIDGMDFDYRSTISLFSIGLDFK